jgi:hypothetical protein
MKNVLFTTTAIAGLALSSAAFAAGHSSGNFGIAGSTDVGYNDDIEGGIFQETNIDITASKDAGNGFMVGGQVRLNLDWAEGTDTDNTNGDTDVEFKSVYVETPIGKLEYTDSSDGTSASDAFYKDRDGMTVDVQNLDGIASLRWSGDMGDFGYAIDTGNVENANSNDWSIGAGGTFGAVTVGLGYDNESGGAAGASSVMGVSADFDAGVFGVGLSYAASDTVTSIAVVAAAEVGAGFTIGAYYANNDDADGDDYGVTLDFANGPFSVAVDYNTGENGPDEIEVDAAFAVNSMVSLYVGYSDAIQGAGDPNPGDEEGVYAGAVVSIADGIEATISYSPDFDEIGGPEFKQGTSAFLSLTY